MTNDKKNNNSDALKDFVTKAFEHQDCFDAVLDECERHGLNAVEAMAVLRELAARKSVH